MPATEPVEHVCILYQIYTAHPLWGNSVTSSPTLEQLPAIVQWFYISHPYKYRHSYVMWYDIQATGGVKVSE